MDWAEAESAKFRSLIFRIERFAAGGGVEIRPPDRERSSRAHQAAN
jgi:hypothetical protein